MAARNKRELPIDLSKNLKELSKVSVTFSSYFSLGEGKGVDGYYSFWYFVHFLTEVKEVAIGINITLSIILRHILYRFKNPVEASGRIFCEVGLCSW